MTTRLELGRVNAADRAAFVAIVAPLFEGAPRFLDRLADARPFEDWEALFGGARAIAHAMPAVEQIELIDAHPRLGAPPASVSALSFREQGYDRDAAGATRLGAGEPAAQAEAAARAATAEAATRAVTAAEIERDRVAAELERLNVAYETRFGFRYCVHVAGRPRAALVPAMSASLGGDPDAERHRALDAVVDIAMDRLSAVLGQNT